MQSVIRDNNWGVLGASFSMDRMKNYHSLISCRVMGCICVTYFWLLANSFDWVLIIGKQLYQRTLAIDYLCRTVGKFLMGWAWKRQSECIGLTHFRPRWGQWHDFSYRLAIASSLYFKMSIKFYCFFLNGVDMLSKQKIDMRSSLSTIFVVQCFVIITE